MRTIRRKRGKRQKQILILSTLALFSILTVGYAAFQTNITLTAKGNVHPTATYTVEQLKETAVTTGDGLYTDPDETGRYVFKGANPNNYLTLNNETWRIMSIESDNTLKIIREDSLGDIVWDPGKDTTISGITTNGSLDGTRYSSASTDYCSSQEGCNVWGNKNTMLDSSGNNVTAIRAYTGSSTTYNLPNDEAYVNIYLNGGTYAGVAVTGWYQTWSSNLDSNIESYIEDEHLYNVGLISQTSGQLTATDLAQEKNYKWKGRVGLMTASEYVRASTNSECTGAYAYYNNSACYNDGASHNYLRKTTRIGTITGTAGYRYWSFSASSTSASFGFVTKSSFGIRPVLYLSSDTVLKGDGTSSSKFQIKV